MLQAKLVDSELLAKYKTILGFYQNLTTQSNKYELTIQDQKKKIDELEGEVRYLSKLLVYFEEFKEKMEREMESRLKMGKHFQGVLVSLQEEIDHMPFKIVDRGLVVPPNFEKILGDSVNLRWNGSDPARMSIEQVLHKAKEEIKELEEKLEKEKEETKRLKILVDTPQGPERRKSISKKDRITPAMTRKSILSNGSKKFAIKVETDSRDQAESSLSPPKSNANGFKFKQFNFNDKKPLSMGKVPGDDSEGFGLLRAETFKQKDKGADRALETIEEGKSRALSNRNISNLSADSERLSISDSPDEEPPATLQADKEKTKKLITTELTDLTERTKSLKNEIDHYSKEMLDSYHYIRGFNPAFFEDEE